MDYTPITSQLLSLACHSILLGWVYWDYMRSDNPDTQHLQDAAQLEAEKPETIPEKLGRIIAAPSIAVLAPNQEAAAFAALPLPKLNDFNDKDVFHKAIKASSQDIHIKTELLQRGTQATITLPEMHVTDTAPSLEQDNGEKQLAEIKQRRSDVNDFTYGVNIIIRNQYNRTWEKSIHKRLSNYELKLLIKTKNSVIIEAELLRGSGLKAFDETLLRWIQQERPSGPPLSDGQYPIVLKLN